jgi:hypothetical protein
MSRIFQRLMSKTVEQFAGSGVGVDDDGRIFLPDGLDTGRMHRFIELVSARRFASPKAALHDLFARVGVADAAIDALNEILGDAGELDWAGIGRHPFKLSIALPRFVEIPGRFRKFLIEDLALADPDGETLEDAVVSTRLRAAELLGCEPSWDAILSQREGVSELASDWRASLA